MIKSLGVFLLSHLDLM